MLEWIEANEALFWGLFSVSIITFLATLLVAPFMLVRLPHDYFAYERRRSLRWQQLPFVVRAALIVAKNLVGGVLLIVGIAMLVTPGQGLMTMIVGLMLLDYPGKYQIERWIVCRPTVLRTINWLRGRAGRRPLAFERDE